MQELRNDIGRGLRYAERQIKSDYPHLYEDGRQSRALKRLHGYQKMVITYEILLSPLTKDDVRFLLYAKKKILELVNFVLLWFFDDTTMHLLSFMRWYDRAVLLERHWKFVSNYKV